MMFKPRPSSLPLALSLLLLAACNQTADPTTPPTPGAPPADAPAALVYGMADSPVYEALKSRVTMTAWDETQKATDFDLVILDGDGFDVQELREDELIDEAVRGSVWVLSLDVEEAHKKDGLGDLLHASSGGDVIAHLARWATPSGGTPISRLIDFTNPDQRPEDVVNRIVEHIERGLTPQQTVPGGNIPTRALTYLVHHTSDYSGQAPQVNNPFFNGKQRGWYSEAVPQYYSWTVDHKVSVFLDATLDPRGDFQHVLVNVTGSADPGGLAIDVKYDDCGTPYEHIGNNCEVAWPQTRFDVSTSMPASSGLKLTNTSPENTNSTETVNSGGYSFNVGYSVDSGASASFQYTSPTTSTTISEWQLVNNSGTSSQWSYASNSAYNGMVTDGFDTSPWQYSFMSVSPVEPNSLSTSNFSYATESYWTNNEVVDGDVIVSGTDSAWYTDAWVVTSNYDDNPDGNNPHCLGLCMMRQHMTRYNPNAQWSLTVDMSAVVPVPTKSLTFSPNPAVAGQPVTGTLTLSAPTPIPAEILMSSDRPGITPEHDSYTIPANEDTLTFNVVTGDEGCQPQSATIQAFYADGQNGVLNVNPPPKCQ